ncbi:MAG: SUMF1/EgtB/PvdO family nonheme iron enzyme [Deltaproteobacteria bacterium]|jgi:formylglycine-generating enzyme required for sulfatase activity|nr:SUMF1/EgtB/PvdO family nonheme iron enzyme [Deltaproteobacteria bacterium]
MSITCGSQMVAGLTVPRIPLVLIEGGTYQLGRCSSIALSTFRMAITPTTNAQYSSVVQQLGTARYFMETTDPVNGRSFVVARGDDPEEIRNADELEVQGWFREAGYPDLADDHDGRGALNVISVGEFDPKTGFDTRGQPAVEVTWYGALIFAEMMRLVTGNDYALPTEYQWGWAAKDGNAGLGYATDTGQLSPKSAHYDHDYPEEADPNVPAITTVHVYDPRYPEMGNGLRHMTGNVWEWTSTWDGKLPKGLLEDPVGPKAGSWKSHCGGSWREFMSDSLNSSALHHALQTYSSSDLGFRLVINGGGV